MESIKKTHTKLKYEALIAKLHELANDSELEEFDEFSVTVVGKEVVPAGQTKLNT